MLVFHPPYRERSEKSMWKAVLRGSVSYEIDTLTQLPAMDHHQISVWRA